jgi:hypothetical protein
MTPPIAAEVKPLFFFAAVTRPFIGFSQRFLSRAKNTSIVFVDGAGDGPALAVSMRRR